MAQWDSFTSLYRPRLKDELNNAFFQQDVTTAHIAYCSTNPRKKSLDNAHFQKEFNLQVHLTYFNLTSSYGEKPSKSQVYANNQKSNAELKTAIKSYKQAIRAETLCSV
jgi:hypothetical protein